MKKQALKLNVRDGKTLIELDANDFVQVDADTRASAPDFILGFVCALQLCYLTARQAKKERVQMYDKGQKNRETSASVRAVSSFTDLLCKRIKRKHETLSIQFAQHAVNNRRSSSK